MSYILGIIVGSASVFAVLFMDSKLGSALLGLGLGLVGLYIYMDILQPICS
jgi:hypothetical protein